MPINTALTTYAEVLRDEECPNISGILPAGALPIFTPLKISAVNAVTRVNTFAAPGAGERIDGFLQAASKVGAGSSDAYLLYGSPETGGVDHVYEAGKEGSINMAHELVFETADYILLTTGEALTVNTAADTELSMSSTGKFKVAAEGDLVQFKVRKILDPKDTDGVRVQIYAVNGYTKPADASAS